MVFTKSVRILLCLLTCLLCLLTNQNLSARVNVMDNLDVPNDLQSTSGPRIPTDQESQSGDLFCSRMLSAAETRESYYRTCFSCHTNSSVCEEMAHSWCNLQEDKCTNPSRGCQDQSCQPIIGVANKVCDDGLVQNSSGDCVCPGTNRVASEVGECSTTTGGPAAPGPGGPSTPPANPAEMQRDFHSCREKQQEASDCCSNPIACIGASPSGEVTQRPGEGISETCKRMQEATLKDSQIRNQAADACTQRQSACKSSCQTALRKWSSDSSMKSLLQIEIQTCESLTSSRVLLGMMGMDSARNSALADQCRNFTRSDPQTASPGGAINPNQNPNQNGQSANGNSPGAGGGFPSLGGSPSPGQNQAYQSPQVMQYCEFNPNNPRCGALREAESTPRGEVGFDTGLDDADPSFNFPGDDGPRTQFNVAEHYDAKNHAQVNPIANNSGGGIPGQAGSGMGAQMGQPRRAGAAPPSYTTDVLKGFQGASGGGAQPSAMNPNADGGWSGYGAGAGRGGRRGPASLNGVDLRQFLPGGARDPRLVGGRYQHAGLAHGIHPRSVNLFHRISIKFREKCRFGILQDCR